jgi:hypothetical protein
VGLVLQVRMIAFGEGKWNFYHHKTTSSTNRLRGRDVTATGVKVHTQRNVSVQTLKILTEKYSEDIRMKMKQRKLQCIVTGTC